MSEPGATSPQITEAMRTQAAEHPGSWVYAIDPFVDPAGRVPPYAIIGAWKVDGRGEITDHFKSNPNYRPSPRSAGMSEPTDPVDSAIQRAATGYGIEAEVVAALARSTVFLVPGAISEAAARSAGEHGVTLAVFSDTRHAPNTVPELQTADAHLLVTTLPTGTVLKVNPGSSASVEIPLEDLQARLGPPNGLHH
ncbi:type VII secretion system-associated protein [Streptomyces sp. NBC_00249]|uniref:type VII secretion system-associated protein n=1 Tax=Streptomyces sp. NBC_00249 TaxID=2975690 RepID=UPI0022507E7D|nr:type VII secretion system-associated protein [Streptomyces sp. NBC_00249]MCX5194181.1 type VII secretion system-associated protein [Streptomyces sp. NBC_00249]